MEVLRVLVLEGEVKQVGSWSGQRGSDGGRLESLDIGEHHLRRLGSTAYLRDALAAGLGQRCTIALAAPLAGRFGSELLGVRLPDGSVRMAGPARLIKMLLGLVLVLPAAAVILFGVPGFLVLLGVQQLLPFLGGLLIYAGAAVLVGFILYCWYFAACVPFDYARARARLSA